MAHSSTGKVIVKSAPHSKESEMMVLGCMLTHVDSLNVASDALEPDDFYFVEHQQIFAAIKTLYQLDHPVDLHIIAEQLKKKSQLQGVGGVPYLIDLAQYAGTSAHIRAYVDFVKNKSVLRRLIVTAQNVEKEAIEEAAEGKELLEKAQSALFTISQNSQNQGGILVAEVLSGLKSHSGLPYLKEIEERQAKYKERGEVVDFNGLPTGFMAIDALINGLGPSNLVICAARPAMGKTALALNVASHVCFEHNIPVGIFSLEMSADQLVHRMICSEAEVQSDKILHGSIEGEDYQKVFASVRKMEQKQMLIDDQAGIGIEDLRVRARRMKEAHDIGLLVVDYLQLLSGPRGPIENRQQEISTISRLLKSLARELDIPIFCLSQLSRKVEERPGHRPMMSDLRDSGSIEQDADVVLLLMRREYYNSEDKPGLGEVIVGKNRHGATGTVEVAYIKEFAKFASYNKKEDCSDRQDQIDAQYQQFNPNV